MFSVVLFVTERCVYVCLTLGVSGSTTECAKCNLHATRQWLVGGHKWHSEEYVPHAAAGCSLLHPTSHPCYSWDQPPAAPWRGEDSSFSFEPDWLLFLMDYRSYRVAILPESDPLACLKKLLENTFAEVVEDVNILYTELWTHSSNPWCRYVSRLVLIFL